MSPRLLFDLIVDGESPPEVPQRVVSRARQFGNIIRCARSQATILFFCEEDLLQLPDGCLAIFVNSRWVITFNWDSGSSRACDIALERIPRAG